MITKVRKLRRDAYPEEAFYADTGCHVHPACLTCPLAVCVFDDPLQFQREKARQVGARMKILQDRGWTADDLAAKFKVSRRTVFRLTAQHRISLRERG